jgi:hypothetical protein
MSSDMDKLLENLNQNPPASTNVLEETEKKLGFKLPAEYVEFLKKSNGGEGFIGDEYVILWRIEELISMNCSYEVEKDVPGFLIFGSNGGGEAFGLDTRTPQWSIVKIPFVGMDWKSAEPMGLTFKAFLECLYKTKRMKQSEPQKLNSKSCICKEIFEIKPIILGGSPTDPANKIVLTRVDHIKIVIYWNKIIKGIKKSTQ